MQVPGKEKKRRTVQLLQELIGQKTLIFLRCSNEILSLDFEKKYFWSTEKKLTSDFDRTKHKAQKLCEQLGREGYAAGAIHGNRSQAQREQVLIQCTLVKGDLDYRKRDLD